MFTTYHGQQGEPFIDIWDCRASIAREVWAGNTGRPTEVPVGRLVYCTNADDLQADILASIDDQGGAITQSGRMVCPPELAARAVWPSIP